MLLWTCIACGVGFDGESAFFTEMYKLMEQQNLKYKTSTSFKRSLPKGGTLYVH